MHFPNLFQTKNKYNLFERDESGRVGGTNTGATVLDWPVGHGELSQVVSGHFWLDHHVPAVGLDALGLLHGLAVLLGLPQPLEHCLVLPLHSAVECAAWAGAVQHGHLLPAHVKKFLEVNSPVCEFTECPPFFDNWCCFYHDCNVDISVKKTDKIFLCLY